ncbi:capsule assembly Wzi family protein [Candidatus Korobacter versatilis]|uniref:capsule assembly Wzi family protein n=1 Tax=Candidatus Korobacter versatilis TaxID=658062 RepID=UPI00030E656B|nr:capsule assembly Wzi family protein [Candidatus Koribacter versatilis]
MSKTFKLVLFGLLFAISTIGSVAQSSWDGSSYVPLDSWVYPAVERLESLGLLRTPFLGMRPWTRLQCAQFVTEARLGMTDADLAGSVRFEIYRELEHEFKPELGEIAGAGNDVIAFDDVYARSMQISGKPLADGEHFGQTITNDFGRPYWTGQNFIAGVEVHGQDGPIFAAFRGEYQYSPAMPSLSAGVIQTLSEIDRVPLAVNSFGRPQTNTFRLLDTYVGIRLAAMQVTFGKQSLNWGPTQMGSMLFSNNVDPPYMLRISQVTPARWPWILRYLGPARSEFFFAKMSGHMYPARPFIHGEKFSFRPTENLEFGISRTTVFLGVGHGMTIGRIAKSYFSVGDNLTSNASSSDPGDRKGGLDFWYRLPKLRNWLSFYNDSFTDDDPSPLAAPARAPMNPGLYLSHVPGIPKLDFRAEAAYTDLTAAHSKGGTFVYYNVVYKDTYTQKGFLLGNVVGRQGKAYQASTSYWFTPRRRLQLLYRDQQVRNDFIPGAGTQHTGQATFDWNFGKKVSMSAMAQYERWTIPLIADGPQNDFTAWLQLKYSPDKVFELPALRHHQPAAPPATVQYGDQQWVDPQQQK